MADATEKMTPNARLVITQLRMENFKSYYGVKDIGPFHQRFSSVVGPNGSGKSNVIDALLFVFGYRAKKIRQGKLKDLIHNSSQHQDLPYCRVTVFFQEIIDKEDGSYDVVPNSQIEFTREANRASQSTYFLNGHKTSLKEVTTFLRNKGIDLDHNRFLILQGEVEQISLMKPKAQNENEDGMLEYLEDIIGSNQFKEQIDEAEQELEKLNEVRSEKLNLVKVVEKEKDSLEEGKRMAEAYLEKENELTMRRSELYQLHRHHCQKNVEQAQAEYDTIKSEFDEKAAQLAEGEKESKKLEKQLKVESKDLEKLKLGMDKAKEDFTAFERKDIKFREERKHLIQQNKKLSAAIKKDTSTLSEHQSKVSAADTDQDQFSGELEKLETSRTKEEDKLEKMMDDVKDETREFVEGIQKKQGELLPLSQAKDDAQRKFEHAQQQLDLLTKRQREFEEERESAVAKYKEAKQLVASRTEEVEALKVKLSGVSKDLSSKKKKLASVVDKEQGTEQSVQSNRIKLAEARSSSAQARSQNQVLDSLVRQKRSGKVPGFHGRLGDLGAIDDKYDCAVTTACGALNHLVVDTVSEAQWCVNFLRQNNVGRATFIILEKIQGLTARAAQPFTCPAGSKRLYDLVKPKDDKFRCAFYHALRDTLVATDLDEATKIAFQGGKARFRVVTLTGQLIDTSGTMSGGGNKAMRGGMSSKLSSEETMTPQELETMQQRLDRDQQSLAELRKERAQLEQQVSALEREAEEITQHIENFNEEIKAARQRAKAFKAKAEELASADTSSEVDQTQLKALEKGVAAAKAVLDKASSKAGKVEEDIKALQAKIDQVGGIRLKAQRIKVEDIASRITTIRQNAARSKADVKASVRKVTQLEKKIESSKSELEANEAKLEKIEAEFKAIEDGAQGVLEAYEKARTLFEEKDEALTELREQVNGLKKQVAKLREEKVDVERKVSVTEKVLKENEVKMKHWDKKIKSLSLHQVGRPEDQVSSSSTDEPRETAEETQAETPMDTSEDNSDKQNEGKDVSKSQAQELREFTEDQLGQFDKEELEYAIGVLEAELKSQKCNMNAIKEYYKKEEEYLGKVADLDQVTSQRDAVRSTYEELRKKRLDMFMAGFSTITMKLKEMYQMITLGGDAELELVDRLNPFSEGIVFSVRPPKKSWKNISNLSGGEKTLSSLALVFALHHYKPTPLYVMDEIDAALDFKNVSIVANYIKERTKNAQFIIISLRNNMFELADRLIGIYKTDDCTKTVTINPTSVAAQAAARQAAASTTSLQAPLAKSAALQADPLLDSSATA